MLLMLGSTIQHSPVGHSKCPNVRQWITSRLSDVWKLTGDGCESEIPFQETHAPDASEQPKLCGEIHPCIKLYGLILYDQKSGPLFSNCQQS